MRKKMDVSRDGPNQPFDFLSRGDTGPSPDSRMPEIHFRRLIDEYLETWEPRFDVRCPVPKELLPFPSVIENIMRDYETRGAWIVDKSEESDDVGYALIFS